MMVSDNGRTFRGKELKIFNANHHIKWRFNLPKAPWWGGMFERLVKSVKRCLKKVIGGKSLSYEELQTILYEVEAVLNNRPLTYADEEDMEPTITPSHLHCGRRTLFSEKEENSLPELTQHEAIGRAKQIEETIQRFWQRWTKEYLLDLREHHKMRTKSKKLNIKDGDVVLIQDDLKKRNQWKMGRVMNVIRQCSEKRQAEDHNWW